MKSNKIMKLLGILITVLVSLSASYAADTSDSNSTDASNQVMTDPTLSDDSGSSDTDGDDSGSSDLDTDDNNDDANDSTDPTIYYAMADSTTSTFLNDSGNGSDSQDENNLSNENGLNMTEYPAYGNGSVSGSSIGDYHLIVATPYTAMTSTDPLKDKIPMQKTGIPILPAELSIISIIGGFMINRIRS